MFDERFFVDRDNIAVQSWIRIRTKFSYLLVRIKDEGRINGLRHRFQALSSDGDERSWTNNPEQATQDLKELGLVDNSGEIVWSQFEKAGHYLLRIESEGGIPDFGLLREFLNNESPEEAGNSDL